MQKKSSCKQFAKAGAIWLFLSVIIPLFWVGLASDDGIDIGFLGLLLLISVFGLIPIIFLVAIIRYLMTLRIRNKQSKADWSAVIENPSGKKLSNGTLPLSAKVHFQDPILKADRKLTSKPNYFLDGSITITDGKLILEGLPKIWGYIFGGFIAGIASGLANWQKFDISISNIEKIQISVGNTLWATPVVFSIFHQDTFDSYRCICTFTLEKVSDYYPFLAALISQVPSEKLIQPEVNPLQESANQ